MFIADFHIHSKYSRATSRDMDLEHLEQWAKIKGIKVMGTGDFTHPAWFKEIASKLEPAEPGLFKLKDLYQKMAKKDDIAWFLPVRKPEEVRYILTTELSCIYSKNNRTRKIHLMIFAPNLEFVEKFNANLGWLGNLKSDGRPILGIDAKEVAKIVLNLSSEAAVIPAHIWTPWFSMFGSMSGFDSVQECFEEYSRNIFAVETGLSSDPAMNWRISKIDGITLISNSDSHSPRRIGREANMFEGKELSYRRLMEALRLGARAPQSAPMKMTGTVEFFPEEGKYHYDGHRVCKIVFDPVETKNHKNKCPACGKGLTIGVMNRVEEMADKARPAGFKPEKGVLPYLSLIPLEEIIADAFDCGVGTRAVEKEYQTLINRFGNEFNVLMNAPEGELKNAATSQVAEGILRVRQGKVKIEPGYDGEYGKVKIFENGEQKKFSKQSCLF
ncbi:MAG: endonuclease Q family protein [Candidatus Portnoybacteria bacterium]|nr:endonuclease Q family protein [Candidatus Portnoybacteria bacterium]